MRLRTLNVSSAEDIRQFFDQIASEYTDSHGNPELLLAYRLGVIHSLMNAQDSGSLIEIGCGTGLHLFALTGSFRHLTGTDLSPAMIERAEEIRRNHPSGDKVSLYANPAESLDSVGDYHADTVLCVGAFEHMPDKDAVLREVRRVLKPGGAFICLTPNADFIWYRWLAPALGLATRHLSTDRFVSRGELERILPSTGFQIERLGFWTFIPSGDLTEGWAWILSMADRLGRLLRIGRLRGGLCFRAVRLPDPEMLCGTSDPPYQSGE